MKKTKRKGFNFFRSYYDVYNELEDKDKLLFMEALLDRQFLGEKPKDLKGMSKFAYISQLNSIDSQVKGYEDKIKSINKNVPNFDPWQGGEKNDLTPRQQVQEKEKGEVQEKEEEKEEVQIVTIEAIASEVEIYPTFIDFWDLYDKKVGKKEKVAKKWNKLKQVEKELIIDYLPKYKRSQPNKKFRKNPEVFLNNESWNDEIIIDNNGKDTRTVQEIATESFNSRAAQEFRF